MFSVLDTVAKNLMGEMHPVQVVWARYASQTLCIVVVLAPRLGSMVRTSHLSLQLLR